MEFILSESDPTKIIRADAAIANQRAAQDFSISADIEKSVSQMSFACNGGGVLAILSFMTALVRDASGNSSTISHLIGYFSFSALIYVLGVIFSVLALFFRYQSKLEWGKSWEKISKTEDYQSLPEAKRLGKLYRKRATFMIAFSFCSFFLASLSAIYGFYNSI